RRGRAIKVRVNLGDWVASPNGDPFKLRVGNLRESAGAEDPEASLVHHDRPERTVAPSTREADHEPQAERQDEDHQPEEVRDGWSAQGMSVWIERVKGDDEQGEV